MQQHDTPGLTAHEAAQRQQRAQQWAARILDLMKQSACSVRLAVRAVEASDKDTAQ